MVNNYQKNALVAMEEKNKYAIFVSEKKIELCAVEKRKIVFLKKTGWKTA